jgi:hypothetical protein
MLQGYAAWPNVRGCISCSYTCSHGISPGVASLIVPPNINPAAVPQFGNLVIGDGARKVTLRGCRVDSVRQINYGDGYAWLITILDRRWQWRYGSIDGWYNQTHSNPDELGLPPGEYVVRNGIYIPGTERSPRQLMKLCLRMMRVRSYIIEPFDDTIRPEINWYGVNPAAALQEVCSSVNARVVYSAPRDTVIITPLGGKAGLLPTTPMLSNSPGIKFQSRVSAVQLQVGPTIFTDYLPLEPVGFEEDGRIRPLDELSYQPENGWWKYHPEIAPEMVVQGESKDVETSKKLAQQSLLKIFRIKVSSDDRLSVCNKVVVTTRQQIYMLGRIFSPERDIKGQYVTKDAFVIGECQNRTIQGGKIAEYEFGSPLPIAFSVDGERGLVVFSRPVYKIVGTAPNYQPMPPQQLYIYTSMHVRHPQTLQYISGIWLRRFGPDTGAPPRHIIRSDLKAMYQAIRNVSKSSGDNLFQLAEIQTNESEVARAADYYMKATQVSAGGEATVRTATFAGIYPISCNGAVHQVTWSVGLGQPPTTTVGVNTEYDYVVPPYPERRRIERLERPLTRLDDKPTQKLSAKDMYPELFDH